MYKNLSLEAPDACRCFAFTMYCTDAAWRVLQDAVSNAPYFNTLGGVLHDVFAMASITARGQLPARPVAEPQEWEFNAVITASGQMRHAFKLRVGPDERGHTFGLLMLPDEEF